MKTPTATERAAEKIVDALEERFDLTSCDFAPRFVSDAKCYDLRNWDHDEARKLIAGYIPQTAAEAEEELDRLLSRDPSPEPSPPSEFEQLKVALHCVDGTPIMVAIRAAIEAVRERDSLRDENAELRLENQHLRMDLKEANDE